jgi:recombination DNA repair RAD52 pathway protein
MYTEREIEGATVTPLTREQLQVLMGNLHPARVQSRKQGGATLSYLAAYDVKAMLIRVFGFGGFSAETTHTEILDVDRYQKDGKPQIRIAALCTVRLYIHQLDAVYSESAVASQTGATYGDVADFAVKTAESDALKRAAINLGTQFGLSLYDNGSTKEVVRKIVSPGQKWPTEEANALSEKQKTMLAESLGAQEVAEATE